MNKSAVIDIQSNDEKLAKTLLDGQLIAYHDSQYEVTSGKHEILMKLFQDDINEKLILFYLQVPYAYPIPDGLKTILKAALELALKKTISEMEFVNAGTEAKKNDINFRIQSEGNFE